MGHIYDLSFVRIGNLHYFVGIALAFLCPLFGALLSRKIGKKGSHILILVLLWSNLALHFLKQFFPGYRSLWPDGLADSLAPNLCAALIMASPFIYLWGPKPLKDYMYYLGIISGLVAIFVPTGAMRYDAYPGGFSNPDYVIEVLRFYYCHLVLITAGFLMVFSGNHKLDYRRLKFLPLTFALFLAIVAFHAILWGPIFKLKNFPTEWVGENGVLYNLSKGQEIANQSMAFGPQPAFAKILGDIPRYFIPGIMTYMVEGKIYFTPVLWVMPFIVLATVLVGPLMTYPFDRFAMKTAWLGFRQKRAMAKEAKRRRRL